MYGRKDDPANYHKEKKKKKIMDSFAVNRQESSRSRLDICQNCCPHRLLDCYAVQS